MNGHGLQKLPSGSTYHGSHLNNKKEGFGVYTYVNGETYEGEWVDGKKHGKARYTNSNKCPKNGVR